MDHIWLNISYLNTGMQDSTKIHLNGITVYSNVNQDLKKFNLILFTSVSLCKSF